MFSSLALLVVSAAACPDGQVIGPDTQGHCCWPQQAWSPSRNVCAGIPACPPPLRAEGQTCVASCPEGMAVGADTEGNCCWPGQVWATSQRRCVGVPQCPAGLTASGETCVTATAPVPPPPPTPPATPPSVGPSSEPPPAAVAPPPPKTHTERRARKGLVITGAALLGVGYIIALLADLGAAIYVAAYPDNNCLRHVSTVGWVPLVGPMWAILGQQGLYRGTTHPCTQEPPYPIGVGLGIVDTALQVAGLSLLIVGLTVRESVEVPDEPVASTRSSGFDFEPYVRLGAPGSSLGITAGARW